MKRYFIGIVLSAVLIAVFSGASAEPSGGALSKAEVDRYIGILEESLPVEWEERDEFIARMRAWGESDDGQPFYMLNLMRLFDEIQPIPGAPATMTPMEANAHYEEVVGPILASLSAYPVFVGDTMQTSSSQKKSNLIVFKSELDSWDRVLIIFYPQRRAFFELVTNPEYLKVMPYKMGSLDVVLTPLSGGLIAPPTPAQ